MSGFRKSERLNGKKCVSALFDKGHVIHGDIFRTIWLFGNMPGDFPARIAVSIPKRLIKKAVIRNILKRRIKEIYRNNKQEFYDQLSVLGINIDFVIIFQDDKLHKSSDIEPEIILTLKRLVKEAKDKQGKD